MSVSRFAINGFWRLIETIGKTEKSFNKFFISIKLSIDIIIVCRGFLENNGITIFCLEDRFGVALSYNYSFLNWFSRQHVLMRMIP